MLKRVQLSILMSDIDTVIYPKTLITNGLIMEKGSMPMAKCQLIQPRVLILISKELLELIAG
jgi:hypothetical protein